MLAVAEWGARNGPNTAIATTVPTTAKPNLPRGSDAARSAMAAQARRRLRAGLVEPGPVAPGPVAPGPVVVARAMA